MMPSSAFEETAMDCAKRRSRGRKLAAEQEIGHCR